MPIDLPNINKKQGFRGNRLEVPNRGCGSALSDFACRNIPADSVSGEADRQLYSTAEGHAYEVCATLFNLSFRKSTADGKNQRVRELAERRGLVRAQRTLRARGNVDRAGRCNRCDFGRHQDNSSEADLHTGTSVADCPMPRPQLVT